MVFLHSSDTLWGCVSQSGALLDHVFPPPWSPPPNSSLSLNPSVSRVVLLVKAASEAVYPGGTIIWVPGRFLALLVPWLWEQRLTVWEDKRRTSHCPASCPQVLVVLWAPMSGARPQEKWAEGGVLLSLSSWCLFWANSLHSGTFVFCRMLPRSPPASLDQTHRIAGR